LFKAIRPVGNKIVPQQAKFKDSLFPAYHFSFYQSGTAALAAAIQACIKLRGTVATSREIIIPAYACPDLISAIHFTGATPVPVDLEPNSSRLSIRQIEENTNENTLALIGVNFLGIQDNILALRKYCEKRQIFFIHDSAQWFPTDEIDNRWCGDYNIISFGRGKPVSVLHGGAVITSDQKMTSALNILTVKEQPPESRKALIKLYLYNLMINPFWYYLLIRIPGLNIGETIFKPLDTIKPIDKSYRNFIQANIEQYQSRRSICSIIKSRLKNIQSELFVDLTDLIENPRNFQLLRYPVLIKDPKIRDSIYIKTRELGVSLLYPLTINKIPGVESILDENQEYPNASAFASHLLTLPTHEGVDEGVIDKIVTIFNRELTN
jgi:dTDP-4-amino-4,6-dideoxygalactose transaminase